MTTMEQSATKLDAPSAPGRWAHRRPTTRSRNAGSAALGRSALARTVLAAGIAVGLLVSTTAAQQGATNSAQPAPQPPDMQQFFSDVTESEIGTRVMRKLAESFADDTPATNQVGGPQGGAAMPPQGETWRRASTRPVQSDDGSLQFAPASQTRVEGVLPLVNSAADTDVQLTQNEQGLITLVVRDASLSRVLALLAQAQGLNIVASNDIDALISITLRDVPLEEALTAILSVANYTWVRKNNIILVTSLVGGANLPAGIQGRQIQVFELDFAKASAVTEAITQFISPIGKVSFSESDPIDNRRTRETVVVEDLPESLARIASYINYIDQPPRQVQIEVHVMEVRLEDENRQGVDFAALFKHINIISAPSLAVPLPTPGIPTPPPTTPAMIATLSTGDLHGIIELLQTTTDAKTLASPRLLVLNEQEARMQIGRQDGYLGGVTSTETSTMQSVDMLETGVILTIRPRITRDNRVLLHVKPEVSDGDIEIIGGADGGAPSALPRSTTTVLETSVMLEDGQGMVLGGLIEEKDVVAQSKVPYLGDIKILGWFFRKSTVTKERREIIIALVPRVMPYNPEWQAYEQGNLVRAGVPLLDGPLCRTNRPFDPILPDGKRVTRPLIPHRPLWEPTPTCYPPDMGYYVPRRPLPEQRLYDEGCVPISKMFGDPSDQPLIGPHGPFLSDEPLPSPEPAWGNGANGPVSAGPR